MSKKNDIDAPVNGWHAYANTPYAREQDRLTGEMTDTVTNIKRLYWRISKFSNSRWGIGYEKLERAFHSISHFDVDPDVIETRGDRLRNSLANHLFAYAKIARKTKIAVVPDDVAVAHHIRDAHIAGNVMTGRQNPVIVIAADIALEAARTALQDRAEAPRSIKPIAKARHLG